MSPDLIIKNMQPKIKAIIFDLGGVITHGGDLGFVKPYCTACLTRAGQKKILELEHQVNLGKITESQFYKKIREIFGVRLTPKQMHNLIVKHMKADKGLVHLIPHLKKAKIALFTNSIGYMALEVLRKRHLSSGKIFDKVFVSTKMRLAKPARRAYQYVLKGLRVKPHEAMMVDDRPENIRAVKKIGMQGIVYKNSRQFKRAIAKYELV